MKKFEVYKSIADKAVVDAVWSASGIPDDFRDMLLYAVSDGGKRVRPVLALLASEFVCGDTKPAMAYATAVELIHSYSLVHDDLPSMDNDDMRRGKPSVHKKFGEANAILVGDALLNLAFEVMLRSENPSNKAMQYVANCAGAAGMIKGQVLDIELAKIADLNEAERKIKLAVLSQQDVLEVYRLKTSKLLLAAAVSGAVAAGGSKEEVQAISVYAENLGLAFQLKDDVFDSAENAGEIALSDNASDAENVEKDMNAASCDELNFVSLFGFDETEKLLEKFTLNAINSLSPFGDRAKKLISFADAMLNRKY